MRGRDESFVLALFSPSVRRLRISNVRANEATVKWNILVGKTITRVRTSGEFTGDGGYIDLLQLDFSDGSQFDIEAECFSDHGCFRLETFGAYPQSANAETLNPSLTDEKSTDIK
jgi:hypothetical protein